MPTCTTTIVRAGLLVLAGGVAAQHNRVPINSDLLTALFVAAVLLIVIGILRTIALPLLGFVLFMHAGNAIVDARVEPKYEGDSMLTRVRIVDFPKVSDASVSMLIEPVDDARLPKRSRVSWYEPPRLPALGEVWELELRLRRPHGNSNPGLFNVENWMFREQLHASGYVVAGPRNRLLHAGHLSVVETYRRDFIARTITGAGDAAPVLAAIGVGARHLISRDQWDRYGRTGSSHLMAISGLHIGLAATAAFVVLSLLCGVFRPPGNYLDFATIGALGSAGLYAVISGLAVPSQRATLMLGLAAIAFLFRRRAEPVRIVVMVALCVFFVDPVSLMLPGFSLSFGAVAVLLWFSQRYWRQRSGLRGIQLVVMQTVLLFGLLPLTVLNFQRISFAAPLVNLLVVPVFSVVTVPLTLASMVVRPAWEFGSVTLLQLCAYSVRGIEWVIGSFSKLPQTAVSVAGVDGLDGALMCVVLLPALWIVLPRGWPGRWIALLGVIAVATYKPLVPQRACVDIHVLDVGQGLAVVLQSTNRALVFDTGASYRGGGSATARFVLPFLRHKGIDSLDWLIVSHADDDHAGGVPALLDQLEVERIYSGEGLPDIERDVVACEAGQGWHADGIEYRFLHPGAGDSVTGNDSSCVLVISAGEHRLLLTGDIETAAERSVLARSSVGPVDVALIPHHGSLTSSSPLFVNRLQPALAIASAGHANRWGFPKERVRKRWAGAGALVLDTASSGAVSLRLCERGGIVQLREQRVRQRRFWHESSKL